MEIQENILLALQQGKLRNSFEELKRFVSNTEFDKEYFQQQEIGLKEIPELMRISLYCYKKWFHTFFLEITLKYNRVTMEKEPLQRQEQILKQQSFSPFYLIAVGLGSIFLGYLAWSSFFDIYQNLYVYQYPAAIDGEDLVFALVPLLSMLFLWISIFLKSPRFVRSRWLVFGGLILLNLVLFMVQISLFFDAFSGVPFG